MARTLLINPDFGSFIYGGGVFKATPPSNSPPLGLLCVAGCLDSVKILDLNVSRLKLWDVLGEFKPDVVGITATTPLIHRAYEILSVVKAHPCRPQTLVGGVHATVRSKEVSEHPLVDAACIGEFEKVSKLNDLPFPAYQLLNPNDYYLPKLLTKRNPVAYLETSRGCYGKCVYCTKAVHSNKMRFKSPGRVIDEIKFVLDLGYREIHFYDDMFTADRARVSEICELILKNRLDFTWLPRGGVRVDSVNEELLKLMKRAGCYRIPFGVESGNQAVLDRIGKGISLEQCREAVRAAKSAGLETEAYYMAGLPYETTLEFRDTIRFAMELDTDYAKVAPMVAFPGTAAWRDVENPYWPGWRYSNPGKWADEIRKFYRAYYFRFGYIWKTITRGRLWESLKVLIKTRW